MDIDGNRPTIDVLAGPRIIKSARQRWSLFMTACCGGITSTSGTRTEVTHFNPGFEMLRVTIETDCTVRSRPQPYKTLYVIGDRSSAIMVCRGFDPLVYSFFVL